MIKTFVLDTNVLVHNPQALFDFEDNRVVIPISVIEELDNLKKLQDERGRSARQVSRILDDLSSLGRLEQGVPLEDGGSIKVELSAAGVLPEGMAGHKVDNHILRMALGLQQQGAEVRFISKDINARIKANALGLEAEDYDTNKVNIDELYRGWDEASLPAASINAFYRDRRSKPEALGLRGTPLVNSFILMRSQDNPNQSALGRVSKSGEVMALNYQDADAWGLRALNMEQKFAMELLLDDSINLVTLVGPAGTGKTLLALAAALQRTVEDKVYRKILVSRPVIPLGKDIGYLPGSKDDKMKNWMQPIFDNLDYLTDNGDDEEESEGGQLQYLMDSNKLAMEAVTYIRGRSIPRQFIIVDEAQNLTPHEVKTIVSRAGQGTKMVLTGDPYQIDNPYLDSESNGLAYLVEKFKGQEMFGHVTLHKSERSRLAALAAELL
jgi:PhoH-like ATPase